jgi:hypothetical protein
VGISDDTNEVLVIHAVFQLSSNFKAQMPNEAQSSNAKFIIWILTFGFPLKAFTYLNLWQRGTLVKQKYRRIY